jgi:concanavalin A-like lectin/glucanase superfamily protein
VVDDGPLRAVSFDGFNDLVSIADAATLDLTTGMTLEAWVLPTVLSSWRTVILKEGAAGLTYALYANETAVRPAAYLRIGNSDIPANGNAALPLNAWSHVATTYDGATLRL